MKPIWEASPSQVLNTVPFLLCLLTGVLIVPLFIALWKWMAVRSIRYTLTKETLTVSTGIFNRRVEQVELFRVKDMTLKKPFWMRLFGVGTLVLLTSDQTAPVVNIEAVPGSDDLLTIIRDLVLKQRIARNVREVDFQGA